MLLKPKQQVEKYEGRFVIRGGKTTTNEGEKSPRTVGYRIFIL
jgi:uncharacterized protein (DUF1330 family)